MSKAELRKVNPVEVSDANALTIAGYFEPEQLSSTGSGSDSHMSAANPMELLVKQNIDELRSAYQKGTSLLMKHKKATNQDESVDIEELLELDATLSAYLTYTEPKLHLKNISVFTDDVNQRLKNSLPIFSASFSGEYREAPRQKSTIMWETQAQQQIHGVQQDIRDLDVLFSMLNLYYPFAIFNMLV